MDATKTVVLPEENGGGRMEAVVDGFYSNTITVKATKKDKDGKAVQNTKDGKEHVVPFRVAVKAMPRGWTTYEYECFLYGVDLKARGIAINDIVLTPKLSPEEKAAHKAAAAVNREKTKGALTAIASADVTRMSPAQIAELIKKAQAALAK